MELIKLSSHFDSKIIAFLTGFLIDQVDDLVDYKENLTRIQKYKKYILEIILISLIIYIIYFNKELSFITTYTLILGGIIGFIFAPNIVNDNIWKIIIFIAIPKFLYTLYFNYSVIKNIENKDMKNIIFIIIPLFIAVIIFSLLENKLIPEEFSNRKILNRLIQFIILFFFIKYNKDIEEKLSINPKHTIIILYCALGWFGSMFSSLINQINYKYNLL